MTYHLDKTLKDINRSDVSYKKAEIKKVLPEYFQEEFPNLITLLEIGMRS